MDIPELHHVCSLMGKFVWLRSPQSEFGSHGIGVIIQKL